MEIFAQFLPLLPIIAIVTGVVWLSRLSGRKNQGHLVGFSGWLLLLAVWQTIAPFKMLISVVQSFSGIVAISSLDNGKLAFYAELLVNLALVALTTCTTIAMWRKHSNFPRLFTWQWLITLTVSILEPVFISMIMGVSVSGLYSDLVVVRGIAQAVAAGVWVWYVHKSVRVQNTFVSSLTILPQHVELKAI